MMRRMGVFGAMARPSKYGRYAAGVSCAALALLVRLGMGPFLHDRLPYFTFYGAVIVAARYWGPGPAALTLIAGAVTGPIVFNDNDWIRLLLYVAVGSLSIWIIAVLSRGRDRAAASARLADERLQQLKMESRQRAREEESSAQLRAIVEDSEDAIISKDLQGIILSWNRGAEQVFGYKAEEAIGKPMSMLVPADRAHEESDILERIRRGGKVQHFETLRARKDGTRIYVSLSISPIRDKSGQVVGVSHIARDITDRKEFEEQLRQTQRLESLGVLAGGLAHDFNNLLTGIMGNASLVIDDVRHSPEARSRITEILQASERAALLVRQMLAYAGKGRFVVEPLDISAQVKEIVDLIRTSIPRSVDLRLSLADDLPPVEGDRSQMQQLIMNLVINAAEAVGDRPGTVSIATWARATDGDPAAVLEVKDDGQGMDEATKARIFDPFYTTKFTGRGLGLAAVMGIIRGHQGTISVESEPGRGSTFTVVLPAGCKSAAAIPPEAAMELRGYGHLLVVDDEELVRNMARFTLERCGYTVETVIDGQMAVETFAKRPGNFAAVLLDLTMPRMNGEEALRRIQEIKPDVPVILSSGYAESEARERFRDRRLAGFLQKPYTAVTLARKIKQALRGK